MMDGSVEEAGVVAAATVMILFFSLCIHDDDPHYFTGSY
jgi:hypothetical protein